MAGVQNLFTKCNWWYECFDLGYFQSLNQQLFFVLYFISTQISHEIKSCMHAELQNISLIWVRYLQISQNKFNLHNIQGILFYDIITFALYFLMIRGIEFDWLAGGSEIDLWTIVTSEC